MQQVHLLLLVLLETKFVTFGNPPRKSLVVCTVHIPKLHFSKLLSVLVSAAGF